MSRAPMSLVLPLLLLLAVARQPILAKEDSPLTAAELKSGLCKQLVELAEVAAASKLNARAKALLDGALVLSPEDAKATKAIKRLRDTTDVDDAVALAKFEKKTDKDRKSASADYCRLFVLMLVDGTPETVNGYLAQAFALHRQSTDDWVEAEYKSRLEAGDIAATQRILEAAAAHPPADEARAAGRARALLLCEADASAKSCVLKKCTSHDMQYWLSLPKGWTPEKKWNVYCSVDGSGCNFPDQCNRARGGNNTTFIVVTPCSFSNTHAPSRRAKYPYDDKVMEAGAADPFAFDDAGLQAVMKDLCEIYSAESKFCMTGYSGGGMLTWYWVFAHPEQLVAAVPSCANFGGAGAISEDKEVKKALIVRAFQGADDGHKPMLDASWESALEMATQNGYENVTREVLPGIGHQSCQPQARKVFLEALGLEE